LPAVGAHHAIVWAVVIGFLNPMRRITSMNVGRLTHSCGFLADTNGEFMSLIPPLYDGSLRR
jgi:hypothetical protein